MKSEGGPLLLEGHGLIMGYGRLALCMHAYPPPQHAEWQQGIWRDNPNQTWEYELFAEGNTIVINNYDVEEELSQGGRVIILDM